MNRGKSIEKKVDLQSICIAATLLLLIIIVPAFAGFEASILRLFLPLVAFLVYAVFGQYTAIRIIGPVSLLCCFILLINGAVGSVFSVITLLFAGYILFHSWKEGVGPIKSCFAMFIGLALCWGAALFLFTPNGQSSYQLLVSALQDALHLHLAEYQKYGNLPADTLVMLEEAKEAAVQVIPLVVPGMLGSVLLMIVCFSAAVGSAIIRRLGIKNPWKEFRHWQIADWVIWGFITAFGILMLPGTAMQIISVNCIMLLCLLYSLQGMSIVSYLLDKRKLRMPIQIIIYMLLLSQAVGVFVLMIFGILSTWIDFRKVEKAEQ